MSGSSQKNEEGTQNETVNWDYKEEMILDRYEETLTIRQVIAPGRELTKEYHMRDEIPELMDKCMEYLGKLKSTSGPAGAGQCSSLSFPWNAVQVPAAW